MSKIKKHVKNLKKKLTKEELEELALQDQINDVVAQADAEANAVDISSLPHFAGGDIGIGVAGATSNDTGGTVLTTESYTVGAGAGSDFSTGAMLAIGALAIGGIAVAASGGGGGGGTPPPSDTTPPVLDSSIPIDGSTSFPSNSNIILTFSENVKAGSGNIVISNGTDTRTISVTDSSQVTISGNTVTINPTTNLTEGATYHITIASGVIKDMAGNNYAGISDATTLNFTTTVADNTAPTVDSFGSSTPDGNYNAGDTINITATMNEAVTAGSTFNVTLDTGDVITLTAASAGTTLTGTYTVGAGDNSSDLTVSSYTAGTVTDTAGNSMTSNTLPATNIADSRDIVVDTLAPTVTINTVAGNDIIDSTEQAATVTVTGTNEAGAITTFNGNAVTQTDATHWSYVLTSAAISAMGQGPETLTVVSTDSAGNSTTVTKDITVDMSLTLHLTTANDNLIGGVGDDNFVDGTYGDGAGPYTLQAADILAGGAGIDTLNVTTGAEASTPGDGLWANKTGFEKIVFTSTGAGAQTVTTGANFAAAFATGADLSVTTAEGAINVDMTGYTPTATITTRTIGAGAHTIVTGTGAATVNATGEAAGAQTINGVGLTHVTALITGAGAQTIGTTTGGNIVYVDATILGAGAQTITSTSGSDVTVVAYAFNGAQTITTAGGNDNITTTSAAGSTNIITANGGNDTIVAGDGNDTIYGGTGADTITGGAGTDALTGNGGVDTFVVTGVTLGTNGTDTIADFTPVDDTIQFSLAAVNAATVGGLVAGAVAADNIVIGAGAVAADANDYFLYDTTNGFLSFDADGNGAGAAVHLLTLTGLPLITAANVVLA